MDIPSNILKEVKGGFGKPNAYEKEGVDAYIEELMLQVEDAKSAVEFKQKELADALKRIKELEESRLLDGDHNDTINNLTDKLKKNESELSAARESYTVMENRALSAERELLKANDKIVILTEECNKYNEALAQCRTHNPDFQVAPGSSQELFTLKQTVAELETENERLKMEAESIKDTDSESAEAKAKELEAELAKKEELLSERDQQLEDRNTQLAVKTNELIAALADINKLKSEIDNSHSAEDYTKLTQENQQLQETIVQQEKYISDMTAELEDAHTQIKKLEANGSSSSGVKLDVSDLFAEAQKNANMFLNAAKEKADTLTAQAEEDTRKMKEDAEQQASEVKEAALAEAARIKEESEKNAAEQKRASEMQAEEMVENTKNRIESMRLAAAEILNQLAAEVSKSAEQCVSESEEFFTDALFDDHDNDHDNDNENEESFDTTDINEEIPVEVSVESEDDFLEE